MDLVYLSMLGADEQAEDGGLGLLAEVAWHLLGLLEAVSADLKAHRARIRGTRSALPRTENGRASITAMKAGARPCT